MTQSMPPIALNFLTLVYKDDVAGARRYLKQSKLNPNFIDQRDPNLGAALMYCCKNRHIEMARMLLNAKPIPAQVNKPDKNGRKPVWWAAQHGCKELAELLVNEFKCDVNFVDSQTGCSPLYRAIVSNSSDVCAILIHAGADVNLRRLGFNVGAESPLMKAVQMDNLAICQSLVNSLCDLNYKTEEGFTALHFAVAYRRYEIVEFLLQNKIKMHKTSNNGVTAMTIAVEHRNPAMCRKLIEFGYNMNKRYKWGETPLEQAINLRSQDCASALVHWGCNLASPPDRPTYFTQAAEAGLQKLIILLVNLQPTYLNEEWVQQEKWPLALYYKTRFCDWLAQQKTNPLTLKELSRAAIFKFTRYFPARYAKLPLPKSLLAYVALKEFINPRIYAKRPLNKECPVDCDFLHPWKDAQCPDVEVSDIDGATDYSDIEADM